MKTAARQFLLLGQSVRYVRVVCGKAIPNKSPSSAGGALLDYSCAQTIRNDGVSFWVYTYGQ